MKKLEWDSKFWEIDVYNIEKDYKYYIPEISEMEYRQWIIQVLLPEDDIKSINNMEKYGFRFVETKVNLIKKVDICNIGIDSDNFKKIKEVDLEMNKNEFDSLFGKNSRFNLFDDKKINEFYYIWMVNTVKGEMDDSCIGYYVDNRLAGFATYRIKNNEFSIGLFGVFNKFRNKGISRKLLTWINSEAMSNGYNFIHVSTQGKNVMAINTYIKNGYIFKNLEDWYYLKGDNNDTI